MRVPPSRPRREPMSRADVSVVPFHTRGSRLAGALWMLGVGRRVTEPVAKAERALARWRP